MIREKDIAKIIFNGGKLTLIKHMALKLTIGGRSNVYYDQELRNRKLPETQLTGQLGEAAAMEALYSFKMYDNYSLYRKKGGDGGTDIPGSTIPIDVKCSDYHVPYFRDVNELICSRKLTVPREEFNPNTIYVCAAVSSAPSHEDTYAEVWVLGWCFGHQMREEFWENPHINLERTGFRLRISRLNPLSYVPFCKPSWYDLLEGSSEVA